VEKEQSDIRKSDISFGRIGHWVIEEAHHGLRGLRAFLRLEKAKTPPLAKKCERAEHLADDRGSNAAGVDYNPGALQQIP